MKYEIYVQVEKDGQPVEVHTVARIPVKGDFVYDKNLVTAWQVTSVMIRLSPKPGTVAAIVHVADI